MQNFWYPHIGEPIRHLFRVKNIDRRDSNGPLGKNVQFSPQNFYIWDKKSIVLFWNHDFLSKGLFTNMSNAQSLVPLILDRGQQNLVGPSGPPKNNPHSQRTSSRQELRRNGCFYVLSKNGFWTKNLFFLQKDITEIR